MNKHFFKTFEFEFEVYRLLWYSAAGGSDFAEVAATTERIKDGDYNSWHIEWKKLAEKTAARAKSFKQKETSGNACLRASRYYQTAEFFLPPDEPQKKALYDQAVQLFYQGLDAKQVRYFFHTIPYHDIFLRTVLFPAVGSARGTVYICGGFDALLEELYFTNAKYLTENGYDVILYEGPGQSDAIRTYQRPFTADWDQVAGAVKKFYQDKYSLSEYTIGMGLSLGGLLLARAASLQPELYDKVILYNYFPSMLASFKSSMPKFFHRYVDQGFPPLLEKIAAYVISRQAYLNWQVTHASWVMGATGLNDLLLRCRELNEELAYEKLTTDVLILAGEQEHFYAAELAVAFYKRIPAVNKKLILFNKEIYSTDLHCEVGSGYDANDQIVEWISGVGG